MVTDCCWCDQPATVHLDPEADCGDFPCCAACERKYFATCEGCGERVLTAELSEVQVCRQTWDSPADYVERCEACLARTEPDWDAIREMREDR